MESVERLRLGEDAHGAELRAPGTPKRIRRDAIELAKVRDDRLAQEHGCDLDVGLRAALGLGDDPLDHSEIEAVRCVEPEG